MSERKEGKTGVENLDKGTEDEIREATLCLASLRIRGLSLKQGFYDVKRREPSI